MWKANGKTTTLSLFLDSLFPKTEIPYICEMIPLETKQSGGKLLPDLRGGSVSRGNVMQALQEEGVQRREGNGIVLEEALDLPFDRLLMMIIIY